MWRSDHCVLLHCLLLSAASIDHNNTPPRPLLTAHFPLHSVRCSVLKSTMDLRAPVMAILVGGSPAPGINGVVCAATLEAIKCGWDVIGFMEGYKRLREGKSKVVTFTGKDVMKFQTEGGSVLRTSKMQPTTPAEV